MSFDIRVKIDNVVEVWNEELTNMLVHFKIEKDGSFGFVLLHFSWVLFDMFYVLCIDDKHKTLLLYE